MGKRTVRRVTDRVQQTSQQVGALPREHHDRNQFGTENDGHQRGFRLIHQCIGETAQSGCRRDDDIFLRHVSSHLEVSEDLPVSEAGEEYQTSE